MALVVSLVLSMLGTLAGAGEPGVTVANFKRLKAGMTEKEVENLFGKAGSSIAVITPLYYKTWKGADFHVRLMFQMDGKLIDGAWQRQYVVYMHDADKGTLLPADSSSLLSRFYARLFQ